MSLRGCRPSALCSLSVVCFHTFASCNERDFAVLPPAQLLSPSPAFGRPHERTPGSRSCSTGRSKMRPPDDDGPVRSKGSFDRLDDAHRCSRSLNRVCERPGVHEKRVWCSGDIDGSASDSNLARRIEVGRSPEVKSELPSTEQADHMGPVDTIHGCQGGIRCEESRSPTSTVDMFRCFHIFC
jgi:hypothetical protein